MNIDKLSTNTLSIGSLDATSAVKATTQTADAQAAAGVDFGSMINDLITNTVGSLNKAEATSIASVRGQASVQQVVEAVMNAQQSLQTALAVRDKAISAYQEISRMAI